MKALHENHLRQHSATAIHFDEKSIFSTRIRRRVLTVKNAKILMLTLVWLTTTIIFIVKPEQHLTFYYSHIGRSDKLFRINGTSDKTRLEVHLNGAFSKQTATSTLTLCAVVNNGTKIVSDLVHFSLVDENSFETSVPIDQHATITLPDNLTTNDQSDVQLLIRTNCNATFTFSLAYEMKPMSVNTGIYIGAAVLGGLYFLIISEIVDRAFASLVASSLAIAALALFDDRPDLEKIVSWIDMDTLMLLFGMMILVAITSETGFFDYMAVFVFKKTKGKVWPLICSLSLFSMVSAFFLDSVSTILLMTPVVIRICEVTNLDPVQVLTIIILAVNIGSTASPVGNPPNVMIINDPFISESGVGFLNFVAHTIPGVFILTLQSYMQIRYLTFKNITKLQNTDSVEVANIKHELRMWQNTDRSISAISKFDDISRSVIHSRVILLNEALEREILNSSHRRSTEQVYPKSLSFYLSAKNVLETKVTADDVEDEDDEAHEELTRRLEEMYPIKNKTLLMQCGIVFCIVICLFFLHAAPYFENLSLGWTSMLGVCLLLIISNNNDDIKSTLLMVEWSSLLFFATLFVLMESLTEIGLIDFIGIQLSNLVSAVSEEHRLMIAVMLVLWVSTFISAFLDNIPLTSMMMKVIFTMTTTQKLSVKPMVWALVFGCGIGGNGTLIASSSNLVCVGVAEQHGYKFSFLKFMKIGLPLMLTNGILVSLYLYILVLIGFQ